MGETTGLCLPHDISRFSKIEPWKPKEIVHVPPPLPSLAGLEFDIMTYIANLSNYVLAAGAMNNLKRVRNRHPRYFASITLFHRAIRTISTNHYQAPVRRFILDLFDVKLTPDTLLQLRLLEQQTYAPRQEDDSHNHRQVHGEKLEEGPAESSDEAHRGRSASSPGPVPDARTSNGRMRGLTVSGVRSGVDEAVPPGTSLLGGQTNGGEVTGGTQIGPGVERRELTGTEDSEDAQGAGERHVPRTKCVGFGVSEE